MYKKINKLYNLNKYKYLYKTNSLTDSKNIKSPKTVTIQNRLNKHKNLKIFKR